METTLDTSMRCDRERRILEETQESKNETSSQTNHYQRWAKETQCIELDFVLQNSIQAQLFDERSNGLPDAILYQSPLLWSLRQKAIVLFNPFIAATLAAYAAGAYSLAGDDLRAKWALSSTEFNIGITIFVLAFGFVPIILALISEIYGRYWVFVGAGAVFFLGTLGCATADSFGAMLAGRLVAGTGASVFATLTGGVVGDLFLKEDRDTPMTLYTLSILAGTGLGPLVSSILVDKLGWQWIFYLQMILIGATALNLFLFFQETRGNVLLERNCSTLNTYLKALQTCGKTAFACPSIDGILRIQVSDSSERMPRLRFTIARSDQSSLPATIWRSFRFPLTLLVTEPIVICFSAWISFAWAVLYMQFNSIGLIYRNAYAFTNTQTGAVWTSVVVGSLFGAIICIIQEHICRRYWPQIATRPEGRLYFACVSSLSLPIGLFWFAWSANSNCHYIVPTIAISVFIFGIFVIYLTTFNYLVDVYGSHASSALAAQSMCRNLLGGIFPLFTKTMLERLGTAHTGSMLGGIGVFLCLVPVMLCIYAEPIRKRTVDKGGEPCIHVQELVY